VSRWPFGIESAATGDSPPRKTKRPEFAERDSRFSQILAFRNCRITDHCCLCRLDDLPFREYHVSRNFTQLFSPSSPAAGSRCRESAALGGAFSRVSQNTRALRSALSALARETPRYHYGWPSGFFEALDLLWQTTTCSVVSRACYTTADTKYHRLIPTRDTGRLEDQHRGHLAAWN